MFAVSYTHRFGAEQLDKLSKYSIFVIMKEMPVGEIKTHFSEVLNEVRQGKKVGILYGRIKEPVALIVPYSKEKKSKRKIGILDGKATIEFRDDFEMTSEELCNL
jgi:antitoxin (DNA-binding transcriptional repressor) of toxin-antitoxin stability system